MSQPSAHTALTVARQRSVFALSGRMSIIRGSNRDKAGINGDFLCIKGRYAFDFVDQPGRLTAPMMRIGGELRPVPWDKVLTEAARLLEEARRDPARIGVIGSNHTTNEENYILQKFARTVLHTNNIDHRRTADFTAFFAALREFRAQTASMAEVSTAPAILLIGDDPTYRHPLLAWQMRTGVRLNATHLYIIHSRRIKLYRQAAQYIDVIAGREGEFVRAMLAVQDASDASEIPDRESISNLLRSLGEAAKVVIIFGSELVGEDIRNLVRFGSRLPNARFICLGDEANSRGAADMGLVPDLLPGYDTDHQKWAEFWNATLPDRPGLTMPEMLHGSMSLLYIAAADPVGEASIDAEALRRTAIIVNDLFLTSTARIADIVFPSASAYEKSGTFTNTCGDLQVLRKAADIPGVRSDLEILLHLAQLLGDNLADAGRGPLTRAELGESRGAQSGEVDRQAVWTRAHRANLRVTSTDPAAVLGEIQRAIPGYVGPHVNLHGTGVAVPANKSDELIHPYEYNLFSSPVYGDYSAILNAILERGLGLPYEGTATDDRSSGTHP